MGGMNPKVDEYFAIGCGRCPLVGTPDCKVHAWVDPMRELRRILLMTELTEEIKWGVPCYTLDGHNVVMVTALKNNCTISFLKGALLKDPRDLLVLPGKNSQAGRVMRFTSVEEILEIEAIILAYVAEAIAVEKAGLKVEYKDTSEFEFPDELLAIFEQDPAFAAAFEALTPGRQRGYLLHFSAAKQSETRTRRIEKHMSRIFEGKGLHDR